MVGKFVCSGAHCTLPTSRGRIEVAIRVLAVGKPEVDCEGLLRSHAGKCLARCKSFEGVEYMSLAELMMLLAVEESLTNIGQARRSVARELLAGIIGFITSLIEVSRGEEIWNDTSLAQLEQLKGAMGLQAMQPSIQAGHRPDMC